MTTFRTDDLTGTVGANPSAANIGMEAISGVVTYVEPGWKETTAIEYDPEAVSTLTETLPSVWWFEGTYQFPEFPTAETTILQARKADLGVVFAVKVTTGGCFKVDSTPGTETSTVELKGKWTKLIGYVNGDAGELTLHILDRTEELVDTLRIPMGGQAVETFREGPLTSGTDLILQVAGPVTMRDTTPLYVPRDRPNIVYVVLDDAPAQAYLKHMSVVADMITSGALLVNNFEATPLCAPSRANMISGLYGQHNGVLGNGGATNDFRAIAGNERNAIYPRMGDLGYRTGHFGKWLHNYSSDGQVGDNPTDPLWKPMGIDWALITSEGYQAFEYEATQNRDGDTLLVDTTGGDDEEADYLTDVIAEHAVAQIDDHFTRYPDAPLFQFVALFAGHNNTGSADPEDGGGVDIDYPAAPRDRATTANRAAVEASEGWAPLDPGVIPDGDLGDDPPTGLQDYYWPEQSSNFNVHPDPLPGWHNTGTLSGGTLDDYEADYFDVVRQMQSANDAVLAIMDAFDGYGQLENTIFIITSDNGYHRGEFAIPTGKGSPYDADCRLPVVVSGPGVTAGLTVTALTQPIDLLPTCLEIAGVTPDENGVTADDVDGSSWFGFVSGNEPDSWRQTGLMQYVSGDVDSWEDAYGTGEPPDWYALRNITDLFVTYDTENQAPPELDRGEAYSQGADPSMVSNLYPGLPAYRGWPVMTLLQALLTSEQGAETREAQYQTFSLGEDERGTQDGPQYVVEGVDLWDAYDRWFCTADTSFPAVPEPSLPNVGSIGDGVLVSGDAHDEMVTLGSAFGRLELVVRDFDTLGRNGGTFQLAANVSAVTMPFVRRGIFTMGERPAPGFPVQWEARTRRSGAVAQDAPGGSTTDRSLTIPIEYVDGYWTSPIDYTWTVEPWKGTNPGPRHVYTLAGSQAPVVPLVRVAGPIHVLTATGLYLRADDDYDVGHIMTWDGGDFGTIEAPYVGIGQWLLIDARTWVARRKTTDDWDLTTGDDVGLGLDSDSGSPYAWRLQPGIFEGDPFDRRVYVELEGTGRDDTTTFQIRAPKTRYV